ncbi:MAG: hypothetical protein R3250_09870, partial [Melioribacteraceae bacterium]|nr:hypothetical protein [Melioribacteraceae bacterium]
MIESYSSTFNDMNTTVIKSNLATYNKIPKEQLPWKLILLFGIFTISNEMYSQKDSTLYHIELEGLLAVEAEEYDSQTLSTKRKWFEFSENNISSPEPDPDGNHHSTASGGKYMEILPDTRVTHDDPMNSDNFNSTPGQNAVITYKTYFNTPGKYYVWARCYSTGTEDNGVHVGIDGTWPESGKRIQWCDGKNSWTWSNKQRTEEQHCGVPYQIYLEIPDPGFYTIAFSMREDGFELDKWIMTKNKDFIPIGTGPQG